VRAGVGLHALHSAFPDARIIGVDPSTALRAQAERRDRQAIQEGRLRLVLGDAGAVAGSVPVDLVVAVHVVYFWHRPDRELTQVGDLLTAGGRLAVGYQLRRDMPAAAQRDFPTEGHRRYESDNEVRRLVENNGFHVRIFGEATRPRGRLLIASRT
jgi:trans-aconitate methyltransferase